MGRGSSKASRSSSGGGIKQVKLPNGDTNLMQGGKRIGLIDEYGNEYRYAGTFKGVKIGAKASVKTAVYIQNLKKNIKPDGWNVKSVSVLGGKRVNVTLVDPNNNGMAITTEKKNIIQR